MAKTTTFHGWTVERDGDAILLYQGDRDNPFPYVRMKGEDGIGPDVLLERAQTEALLEELRLAKVDISGDADVYTAKAIRHFRDAGDPAKAEFLATSRARQRERSAVAAMMAAATAEED